MSKKKIIICLKLSLHSFLTNHKEENVSFQWKDLIAPPLPSVLKSNEARNLVLMDDFSLSRTYYTILLAQNIQNQHI